jgi:hypothetical protein
MGMALMDYVVGKLFQQVINMGGVMKHKLNLIHEVTILNSWINNPEKDNVSNLSETNAKRALDQIKLAWKYLERRTS